jgi:hypothetical protein
MASAVPRPTFEMPRARPLTGLALGAATIAIWLAGALYCSGYEALASGLDNWPGSLWWSAVAVLPWLALFEWSKTGTGRHLSRRPAALALALVVTAATSLLLEAGIDGLLGGHMASLGLSVLRRLPAAGVGLVLILWSRAGLAAEDAEADEQLVAIAGSIDWIGAADNYVELHVGERTLTRRMTMRQAEQILAPHGFIRIHRRFLVNRARIERIGKDGARIVRLADGGELPVGRAFAANLNRPG